MKDSIRKLKELRDSLCTQQGAWKDAFAARDKVISDLIDVYKTCVDKKSRKKTDREKVNEYF